MARPFPTSRVVLAMAVAFAATLAACGGKTENPASLEPDEERLVEEVLQLIEVRIARARDAAEAEVKREALPPLYSQAEVQEMIDDLARRPERGQLIVGAIHESLTARREQLLRPDIPKR